MLKHYVYLRFIVVVCFVFPVLFSLSANSEVIVKHQLDAKPYDPEKDPDIDMYISNWKDSPAYQIHKNLVERDVLSRGNPATPERRGAVLNYVNRFTHASLYAGNSTEPATLSGEQEILFITSGSGVIKSDGKIFDLYPDVFVLVPDRCTYTMSNTGDEPLTMYLICEPVVRNDFTPQKDIITVDENKQPILTTKGHWSMIIKQAFSLKKELSIIEYVNTIVFDPMTIGHPHAHLEKCEEVWTALEGTSILFLGKEIRMQPPGTAYLCPPYGTYTHSNINHSDKPVKFLYFAVRDDWSERDGIKRSKE